MRLKSQGLNIPHGREISLGGRGFPANAASSSGCSMTIGIVGKRSADKHRAQELAASRNFRQRLIVLRRRWSDRFRGVQRLTRGHNTVRPSLEVCKFVLQQVERITIGSGRCSHRHLVEVALRSIAVILRPASHDGHTKREDRADGPLHSRISASSAMACLANSRERPGGATTTGGGGGGGGAGAAPAAGNVRRMRLGSRVRVPLVNCATVSMSTYERPPISTAVPAPFPFTIRARSGAFCASRISANTKTIAKKNTDLVAPRFLMVTRPVARRGAAGC